jgi:hypothetical protein
MVYVFCRCRAFVGGALAMKTVCLTVQTLLPVFCSSDCSTPWAGETVPANDAHWLARTALLRYAAGAAVVGVPDQVSAEQLAKRFDPLVRRALSNACGEAVTVQYEVVEG